MKVRRQSTGGDSLRGEPMRKSKEILLIVFEAVTVGGALLLVPCVLADLVFGCALTEPLAQVMLAAAVSTALLTALALHEGWYADHLTDEGARRAPIGPARYVEAGPAPR